MSRIYSFLLGLVSGALLVYAMVNYHLVRASDGFHVVNKQPPRMGETYVDIRGFGVSDWISRPKLATALANAKQQRLLGDSAAGALRDGVSQVNQVVPSWPSDADPR